MNDFPRIVIVGGGAIGTAIAGACLSQKLCLPEELEIIEVSQSQQSVLKKQFGCFVTPAPHPGTARAELVILAIKPADAEKALQELAEFLVPGAVVLSVMAGVTAGQIKKKIHGDMVVCRAMPNLGAQYRAGVSGVFFPAEAAPSQVALVLSVLESFGKVIQVKEEKSLDAITAISGSGPAYFFLLGEYLMEGAKAAGFSDEEAALLARETMRGALTVWDHQNLAPRDLRSKVTSKGGTTAAAVQVLEENGWKEIFLRALEAARLRAGELSSMPK